MDRLTCDIVRDLMPMAMDDTASADSKMGIAAHIQNCGTCRAYYEGMARQMSRGMASDADKRVRPLAGGKIKKFFLSAMAFLMIGVIRCAGLVKMRLQEKIEEDENGQADV